MYIKKTPFMQSTLEDLNKILPSLNSKLKQEICDFSILKELPKNTEILREGQYIKAIPLVVSGLIKVYTRYEDRELLLYYIRPKESCTMSFAASINDEPSKVFAETEENTKVLLLPISKIPQWVNQFPDMNNLFFKQYGLRYAELLDTIHHILFNKLDVRLYKYLKEKVLLTKKNPLVISHRQIANELGTAREVISRIMKKLELEGKVKQHSNSVEIL